MPIFIHSGEMHYFCHVPKCAGTSVEYLLEQEFGELLLLTRSHFSLPAERRWSRTSPQHIAYEDLRQLFPVKRLASSFAIVRDPLARLISAYKHAWRHRELAQGTSLERWFDDYLLLRQSYPYAYDNHLRPQVDFLLPGAKLFRMEDQMDQLLVWLQQTFGINPDATLDHHNTGELATRDLRVEKRPISAGFLDKVTEFYAADYRQFGYEMPVSGQKSYEFPALPGVSRLGKAHLRFAAQRLGHLTRRAKRSWHRSGAPGRNAMGYSIW